MKKILPFLIVIVLIAGCKKTGLSPDGPTDIRIHNATADKVFENVVVNTSAGEHNYGAIQPGLYTGYLRFDKAYPEADITLTINGVTYTAGPQNYTFATYIGQFRITYELSILDEATKKLKIETLHEGPLQ